MSCQGPHVFENSLYNSGASPLQTFDFKVKRQDTTDPSVQVLDSCERVICMDNQVSLPHFHDFSATARLPLFLPLRRLDMSPVARAAAGTVLPRRATVNLRRTTVILGMTK